MMTRPEEPRDDLLTGQFARYRRELFGEVRAPGADGVRRVILRRQRARMSVLGVVAALALVVAVSQFIPGWPWPAGLPQVPTSPAATPSSDPSPSASVSATPSRSPSTSPSPDPTASAVTGPPFQIVDGVDIHVVGPSQITLQPSDGRYRGTVTIDAYHSGRRPYEETNVYLTLPPGVTFHAQSVGGCVGAPSPETLTCYDSRTIPAAGGHLQFAINLEVAIAPQATAMTLDDAFGIRIAAAMPDTSKLYPDASPTDNKLLITLVLAAA